MVKASYIGSARAVEHMRTLTPPLELKARIVCASKTPTNTFVLTTEDLLHAMNELHGGGATRQSRDKKLSDIL